MHLHLMKDRDVQYNRSHTYRPEYIKDERKEATRWRDSRGCIKENVSEIWSAFPTSINKMRKMPFSSVTVKCLSVFLERQCEVLWLCTYFIYSVLLLWRYFRCSARLAGELKSSIAMKDPFGRMLLANDLFRTIGTIIFSIYEKTFSVT